VSRGLRYAVVALGVVALLALGASPMAASGATPRTNLPDVEDEVMCTICGTLLAESDSPQANGERALIRKLIAEDQIKDALVAQYGRNVLATPTTHGFDLVAWVVPGLVILAAAIGLIVVAFRLRRRRGDRGGPPPDLDPGDAARLERELSSYDG
jgi:cytochrome c-type biogenesis protein CcmH